MGTPRTDLAHVLTRLEGNSYGAYKQLKGDWRVGDFELIVDRVQSDPYAPPSMVRIRVPRRVAGIPEHLVDSAAGRIAAGDFLTRAFGRAARNLSPDGGKGSGGIFMVRVGQEILQRSSVLIDHAAIEVRCEIALPAAGRRIKARAAQRLLTEVLPSVVDRSLIFHNLDAAAFDLHVRSYLDAEHVRAQLATRALVAFVADGAVLPRASGHRDEPLTDHAVPFESPDNLRVTLTLSDGTEVSGLGIPEGVTVIVGGGYHGKSTLLQALERGVYDHVPGDGRELVITRADAMAVRAEDGRAVTGTDVSPFITNLPTGADTKQFSTTNASGSTSQAASTTEAVESGAKVLLLDEDTCATNLMVRDQRMRALVPDEHEPITPFVDRVRALYRDRGVSTVLVTGGSGAFLDVADLVIAMDATGPRTPQPGRVRCPRISRPGSKPGPPRFSGSCASTSRRRRRTTALAAPARMVAVVSGAGCGKNRPGGEVWGQSGEAGRTWTCPPCRSSWTPRRPRRLRGCWIKSTARRAGSRA